jgi:hypothetical protein
MSRFMDQSLLLVWGVVGSGIAYLWWKYAPGSIVPIFIIGGVFILFNEKRLLRARIAALEKINVQLEEDLRKEYEAKKSGNPSNSKP